MISLDLTAISFPTSCFLLTTNQQEDHKSVIWLCGMRQRKLRHHQNGIMKVV